jgi:hypothetical protein
MLACAQNLALILAIYFTLNKLLANTDAPKNKNVNASTYMCRHVDRITSSAASDSAHRMPRAIEGRIPGVGNDVS